MFFEDWADHICDQQVRYSIVETDGGGKYWHNETVRVDFVKEEDAVVMKLKGIPDEFRNYLTLLNR